MNSDWQTKLSRNLTPKTSKGGPAGAIVGTISVFFGCVSLSIAGSVVKEILEYNPKDDHPFLGIAVIGAGGEMIVLSLIGVITGRISRNGLLGRAGVALSVIGALIGLSGCFWLVR